MVAARPPFRATYRHWPCQPPERRIGGFGLLPFCYQTGPPNLERAIALLDLCKQDVPAKSRNSVYLGQRASECVCRVHSVDGVSKSAANVALGV